MDPELKRFKEELLEAISHFKSELQGVRTSRPTSRLIEDIKVEYFGQMTPVKQLGSIMIVPPYEMAVGVWDRGAASEVAKAIEAANLGLSVSVDGSTVRLHLPMLSADRREELLKLAKTMAEKERIRVRGLRDEANKRVKALGANEDVQFTLKEGIQELTNEANKEIDSLLAAKTEEIAE